MLILAGVSINALVGDNGVLTQTQYASFLNEMSAVEEAVGIWKAGKAIEAYGAESNAIPTNGMCSAAALQDTERLIGEIGYYRVWSIGGTRPTTNIESASSAFNSAFESELIFFPAGVQDLYYLNNEVIGIAGNKTYLIDASTGLIYSMTGIGIKGIRVYSTAMAKAVMNGDTTMPLFAEAEVSGGSGQKLAGNVTTEYVDTSGNPVYKRPDGTYVDANGNVVNASDVKDNSANYNPNGFEIIAAAESNNIFKLYNNGDLYGKGIKGTQLNTSPTEMAQINQYVWNEFVIPENVGNVKKIIVGKNSSLYFIDSNDNLWVYGSNRGNKFGLTEEQIKEYTGREATKVDLNGKKVRKIFPESQSTWLILDDNKLYVAGSNFYGELGLGNKNATGTFTQVPGFTDASDLSNVYAFYTNQYSTILEFTDSSKNKSFYYSGDIRHGQAGIGISSYQTVNFVRIWDGNLGPNIANDVKMVLPHGCCCNIIKNDGYVYHAGNTGYIATSNIEAGDPTLFRKFTNMSNVIEGYAHGFTQIFIASTGKIYATPRDNELGLNYAGANCPVEYTLSSSLASEGLKEVYVGSGTIYYLSNANKLYASGQYQNMGLNKTAGTSLEIEYINVDNLSTLYNDKVQIDKYIDNALLLYEKGGKYYTTGLQDLIFGDKILQKSWSLVAKNVKYFDARNTAYVDRDGYVWVAGDSRTLGLGDRSKTYENITNYIKVTDSNLFDSTKGIYAEKVYQADGVTYVLLNNKKLYATGMYSDSGKNFYPGWSEDINKSEYVELLSNVELFSARDYNIRFAINSSNECVVWGCGISNGLGNGGYNVITPTNYNLPTEIGSTSNVKYVHADSAYHSHIITKTGELWRSGSNGNYAYYGAENNSRAGGSTRLAKWSSPAVTLDTGETIVKFLDNQTTGIVLTSKGRIFGYGSGPMLGINHAQSDLMSTREITGITDVEQIVMGNGWLVAVKKDGTVWGTGSNTYGILGRWVGIGRGESNSRYKTALNWVECPELEI